MIYLPFPINKNNLFCFVSGATGDDNDFFIKEREWVSLYAIHIKDTCDRFQALINSQMKMSNQVSNLATILGASAGGREGTVRFCLMWLFGGKVL